MVGLTIHKKCSLLRCREHHLPVSGEELHGLLDSPALSHSRLGHTGGSRGSELEGGRSELLNHNILRLPTLSEAPECKVLSRRFSSLL